MGSNNGKGDRDGWARLRFAVVGPLLASPPPRGRLRAALERLARQSWEHPTGGRQVQFSVSTIERWYYQARAAHQDPVKALRRRARTDVGRVRTMSAVLIAALRDQYRAHPSWSAQLHHDNLQARVDADPSLGPMPSYTTLTRVMRSLGLVRRRRRPGFKREAERPAVEAREVLSYEVSRSHALWHADYHHGRRGVLTAAGRVEDADPARLPRRPLAAGVPPAMVSGGNRGGLRSRALPGPDEAWPAALADDRQRCVDDGRGGPGGAAPARHRPCDDARVLPLPEWQAGSSLGLGRGTPDGHARRRRAAHPGDAQQRDRRMAGARLPPPRAPRAGHDAAQAAARKRRCVEALPGLGRAQGSLPDHRKAQAAALRRHRVGRGRALPGAGAVAPLDRALDPLRALGPGQRRSGRRPHRRAALHPLPARQARQCRRGAASPRSRRRGQRRGAEPGPAPLLQRILDDQAATGLPPLWLPHPQRAGRDKDDDQGDPS